MEFYFDNLKGNRISINPICFDDKDVVCISPLCRRTKVTFSLKSLKSDNVDDSYDTIIEGLRDYCIKGPFGKGINILITDPEDLSNAIFIRDISILDFCKFKDVITDDYNNSEYTVIHIEDISLEDYLSIFDYGTPEFLVRYKVIGKEDREVDKRIAHMVFKMF